MVVQLKLNEIRSVIKNGAIFNKVEENKMKGLVERWPRKFLRCFVNGSGKRKKFFAKT
jgi:hypothetical protein